MFTWGARTLFRARKFRSSQEVSRSYSDHRRPRTAFLPEFAGISDAGTSGHRWNLRWQQNFRSKPDFPPPIERTAPSRSLSCRARSALVDAGGARRVADDDRGAARLAREMPLLPRSAPSLFKQQAEPSPSSLPSSPISPLLSIALARHCRRGSLSSRLHVFMSSRTMLTNFRNINVAKQSFNLYGYMLVND